MLKKTKPAPKPAPKAQVLSWWDSTIAGSLDTFGSTTRMLVEYALAHGKTIYTGTCLGILEDEGEEGAFQDLLKDLSTKTGGHVYFTSAPIFGRGESEIWFLFPQGSVLVKYRTDLRVAVTVSTMDEGVFEAIGETLGTHLLPENVRQPIYALARGPNGIEISDVGTAGEPFEPENYMPEIEEDFKFVVAELQREMPIGRLILISGKPGTGKTYFIRGVIHDVLDAIFVLVPAHLVNELAGPELVPMLVRARGMAGSTKPIVLILEDADRALVPREEGSLAAISALLNVSDGILGHALNLRIVCTTNAEYGAIDEALKRPGRLSKQIQIGLLSPEKAGEVYCRISDGVEGQFDAPVPLAEVYRFYNCDQAEEEEEETDDTEEDEDGDEDDDEDGNWDNDDEDEDE